MDPRGATVSASTHNTQEDTMSHIPYYGEDLPKDGKGDKK